MAKSKLKLVARTLRREKRSIKSIAKELNVSVSSISVWCRDIIFSAEDQLVIKKKGYYAGTEARLQAIKRRREELDTTIEDIHLNSVKEIGQLTKREILIAGTALYWGEGFKKDSLVGLASMSSSIAKFYIKWLTVCFGIKKENLLIRVTLNSNFKQHTNSIMQFWSKELEIPLSQFAQSYYQHTTQKKEYENRSEYHGVIRIKARRSIGILRQIEGYIRGLSINS
jgi:hypothetical protein